MSARKPSNHTTTRTKTLAAKTPKADRRQFLIAAVIASAGIIAQEATADTRDGVELKPNPKHQLFRVRVELDVKGNVDIASNPLVSRKISAKLPITSNATFDYEERFRFADDQGSKYSAGDYVTCAERYYHKASVESSLNKTTFKSELRESVRQAIVRRETMPEVIYSVDDYFTRDELDLLRLPASSVGLDSLLPSEKVTIGSKYRPDRESLASVLNLTSADVSDIEAEVVSLDESEAKIQFKGQIDGSVDGVPTVVRAVGKLTFDRQLGTCTWLAMALHETRDIGIAEPGFDVAATIRLLRKPTTMSMGLSQDLEDVDVMGDIPADRMFVDLQSDYIGFATLMNRQWRMMTDVPGAAMMRMTRDDRSVAQCDFRPLPSLEAGKQWTLEAFAEDVKRTLGDQLVEIVEAEERVSATDLRVLRVSATGSVEGVPIQWVLMHFSDDAGRRMLATFTLEEENMKRFAGSDLQLADSMRLIERSAKAAKEVADDESQPKSTRIADAISNDSPGNEVQSASDLK
ncbi:hypothetical protein Pla22_11960 [Rubripirellula amarantea]|uniref:Uncharacterized protein n=1 Tax=Rubripirellula amarantea TaxID=2527999 RepID=A0A5C5WSI0_9BACT|nr:hypothetical protein [Rubripirellula amarantea]TWT53567.1 hypothetical protein Pla22_11960 [Rubripirellula amarantea]